MPARHIMGECGENALILLFLQDLTPFSRLRFFGRMPIPVSFFHCFGNAQMFGFPLVFSYGINLNLKFN